MNADELTKHLADRDGVVVLWANGDAFLIYDPEGDLPPERQQPFATVVTGDHYDSASDLDSRGAVRLNLGLTKATYRARFADATDVDYTAVDVLMPHPEYGPQHWICVVNPSQATLDAARPLIDEAYGFAVRKHRNWRATPG